MDVRLKAFTEALESLSYLTEVDMAALAAHLDKRLIDALDNGKAQKFEYTLELCWKAIKVALKEQEGIDEASPKKVVKAWYLAGHLPEDDYLALLAAIDDRNKLSHIYDAEEFMAIVARLPAYARLMQRVNETLNC
ncbi:HI0074 family nucleotidyltransferase substrate-binding subunit [Azonexus sp.]|uniref:HI0074 family nucleotidyltransferase substrate-binding subunit n=1 Tax=Azonexus sp. TaxID=1872668 RepID=UPI0035B482A4